MKLKIRVGTLPLKRVALRSLCLLLLLALKPAIASQWFVDSWKAKNLRNYYVKFAHKRHVLVDDACALALTELEKRSGVTAIESKSLYEGYSKVANLLQSEFKVTPKRVLYPASGHDVDTLLRVFPDANEIILVDHHPFVQSYQTQSKQLRFIKVTESRNFDLRDHMHSDHKNNIAPMERILGELEHQYPNLRLHEVEAFSKTHMEHWDVRILYRDRLFGDVYENKAIHGRIVFDVGPGTEKKEILYLNFVNGQIPLDIEPLLADAKIDGLIVKAAMGIFNPISNRYNENIKKLLLKIVNNNKQLVVVEGYKIFPVEQIGAWEFSDRQALGNKTKILENLTFGYQSRVKVSQY